MPKKKQNDTTDTGFKADQPKNQGSEHIPSRDGSTDRSAASTDDRRGTTTASDEFSRDSQRPAQDADSRDPSAAGPDRLDTGESDAR